MSPDVRLFIDRVVVPALLDGFLREQTAGSGPGVATSDYKSQSSATLGRPMRRAGFYVVVFLLLWVRCLAARQTARSAGTSMPS